MSRHHSHRAHVTPTRPSSLHMTSPSSSRSPDHDPHRTIYYLGYPLGRFAGLKHRQLARQVGVIVTTGRIRRTLVNKINPLVDSPRSIEASRLAPVKAESIFLHRASGCFDTSRGMSRDSSSTTSPRAGSSLTTSPMLRVRVPRHIARLVTRFVADYFVSRRLVAEYFAYAARLGASARRTSSTTWPTSGARVPRHVARLVVDYFTYAARLVASAHRAACRGTRRRLLRLRRASGCLCTSCGSSRGSWSTTSPTPRVRVPRHVARLVTRLVVDYFASRRLVVDYFAYTARPGASARRAARHAARRRLLRLRRASRCLAMSCGSSRRSS
jgi:hypothetical protein